LLSTTGTLGADTSTILTWALGSIVSHVTNVNQDAGVAAAIWGGQVTSTDDFTAPAITFSGQSVSGGGTTITAGALTVQAGNVVLSGHATNGTAGDTNILGGDVAPALAGTIVTGNLNLRGGRGPTSATDANVSIHATPASYQGMRRGLFIGDAAAAPTGNPANGLYLFSDAGKLSWRSGTA